MRGSSPPVASPSASPPAGSSCTSSASRQPAARYGIAAIVMYSLGLVVGTRIWLVRFSQSVREERGLLGRARPEDVADFEREKRAREQRGDRARNAFDWADGLGSIADLLSLDEAAALLIVPALLVLLFGGLLLAGVVPALLIGRRRPGPAWPRWRWMDGSVLGVDGQIHRHGRRARRDAPDQGVHRPTRKGRTVLRPPVRQLRPRRAAARAAARNRTGRPGTVAGLRTRDRGPAHHPPPTNSPRSTSFNSSRASSQRPVCGDVRDGKPLALQLAGGARKRRRAAARDAAANRRRLAVHLGISPIRSSASWSTSTTTWRSAASPTTR